MSFSCFPCFDVFLLFVLFVCFGLFTGDLGGMVSFKNWVALWDS